MQKMKTCRLIATSLIFTVLFMTGCENECRNNEGICPSGEFAPEAKKENCTWNDIVKCGGCAQYSLKYGRTKCFNSSTGVGESDCNNECLECKVATYKPGVYCVNFRYDEGGCKNAKCEFYIASVSEKSLQDILFVQE